MKRITFCNSCHAGFFDSVKVCPNCGTPVEGDDSNDSSSEGEGRMFRAGGAACDSCPHCYGSDDWCTVVGD